MALQDAVGYYCNVAIIIRELLPHIFTLTILLWRLFSVTPGISFHLSVLSTVHCSFLPGLSSHKMGDRAIRQCKITNIIPNYIICKLSHFGKQYHFLLPLLYKFCCHHIFPMIFLEFRQVELHLCNLF